MRFLQRQTERSICRKKSIQAFKHVIPSNHTFTLNLPGSTLVKFFTQNRTICFISVASQWCAEVDIIKGNSAEFVCLPSLAEFAELVSSVQQRMGTASMGTLSKLDCVINNEIRGICSSCIKEHANALEVLLRCGPCEAEILFKCHLDNSRAALQKLINSCDELGLAQDGRRPYLHRLAEELRKQRDHFATKNEEICFNWCDKTVSWQ